MHTMRVQHEAGASQEPAHIRVQCRDPVEALDDAARHPAGPPCRSSVLGLGECRKRLLQLGGVRRERGQCPPVLDGMEHGPSLDEDNAGTGPPDGLAHLRARLARARCLWRDFTGESAYDRYIERHRREHPDHEPMSEREWWRARAEHDERSVSTGCC